MTETRQVPFFNYPANFTSRKDEYLEVISDVLGRGAFILQEDLARFERNLEDFLEVKHVLGVADGTNALILALRALDIGPGDEVILASHTYIATAASVHFVGATPVLLECGRDHMIDPDSVEQAITDRTRVLMPTQLNGRTANMDRIMTLAEKYDLHVVEDAAQALGSKFRGKCAGTFGIAGTFSFYPAKVLGCFGDGGAVVTNDDDMARKLSLLRDHGRNEDGEVVAWGLNSRLDNLQAAILDFKLKTYDRDIDRRREIAALYQDQLGDLAELDLPPAPDAGGDHFDIYQNYEIEADRRDELREFLMRNNIGCPIQWGGKAVHQFENLGFDDVSLPATDRLFTRCFMLPMHPFLSDEDVMYVCRKIREFYGKNERS